MEQLSKIIQQFAYDIKQISSYVTDSSHSEFYMLQGNDDKRYICKRICDKTLAGTEDCVIFEFNALSIANKAGLAPKPLFVDKDNGIIILEYIDAVEYDSTSLASIMTRAEYAKRLSMLKYENEKFIHMHGDFYVDFNNNLRMLEEAQNTSNDFSTKISKFKQKIALYCQCCCVMNEELASMKSVLSHNDLVGGNLLKGKDGKYYMIDFETAGLTKIDFIIGQLAVDAEIDWYITGEQGIELQDLYDKLNEIFDNMLPFKLFLARVLERLTQNICYGYRQLSLAKLRSYQPEYVSQKRKVIQYCTLRAEEVKEMLQNAERNY